MTGRGRPLRFLALVIGAWVSVRAALLWPHAETLPEAVNAIVPILAEAPPPAARVVAAPRPARPLPPRRAARPPAPVALTALPRPVDPVRVQFAMAGLLQFGAPEPAPGYAARALPPALGRPDPPRPSRWSASAWLMSRGGAGAGGSPRLGASQAGLRLAYALDPEQRLAVVGRVTAPLQGRGSEATIGVEWRPARAPVRLVAEQRFGLDGTPNGTAIGAVAWADARLPRGFRLEAYGQAGVIARAGVAPHADGQARVMRPVADRVELGLGSWGAAQRDAARLDAGPSAVARVPLAGRELRLAIDWRERLAGAARPGSGVALTLATDF